MLKSDTIEFNNGGEFLELSVNVVRDGERNSKYIRVARGFYNSDGEPRYKKGGLTLPMDQEALNALAEAIKVWDWAGVDENAPAPDKSDDE